jgi:hypothetical protein
VTESETKDEEIESNKSVTEDESEADANTLGNQPMAADKRFKAEVCLHKRFFPLNSNGHI